jgi:putative nucleotidyltransferase with HDIG domain
MPIPTEDAVKRLQLVNLPPFPAVAIGALQLVSKSETRLSDLHSLISADPAFVGEILRLVNSPIYGIRAEITSTLQATMLLGFERVKGLALTIGMKAYISGSLHVPALRASWRHSLACAMVAEELASGSSLDKDVAYTAALIHDIGRLALTVMQPHQYDDLMANPEADCAGILRRERELFGMDHCEAGRWLTASWNLPAPFGEITSRHHEVRAEAGHSVPGLVGLSCRMADALGFAFVPHGDSKNYEELIGELPESGRRRLPADPDLWAQAVAQKIDCIEATGGQESHSVALQPAARHLAAASSR